MGWATSTKDHETLTILNDALTRDKCEGGNVNALTAGAPVGNVLAKLANTVSWNGYVHQVMQKGTTYPCAIHICDGQRFVLPVLPVQHVYKYSTICHHTDEHLSLRPGHRLHVTRRRGGRISQHLFCMGWQRQCGCLQGQQRQYYLFGRLGFSAGGQFLYILGVAGNNNPTPAGYIAQIDLHECGNLTQLNVQGLTSLQSLNCLATI